LYSTQSVRQTICNNFELVAVLGLEEVGNA
jgi:hypothetical protein